MRILLILSLSLILNNAHAFSFDPSLVTAMNDAEIAINEELSIAEPTLCKRIFNKAVGVKSKNYKSCQNYRATLTNYQRSIFNAKKAIQTLDEWMPTEKLFVSRSENFVFLNQPSRTIQKFNTDLIGKLDLLYSSIYQYPLQK